MDRISDHVEQLAGAHRSGVAATARLRPGRGIVRCDTARHRRDHNLALAGTSTDGVDQLARGANSPSWWWRRREWSTDNEPPSTPTGLTATVVTASRVDLRNASTDNVAVTNYEIRRDGRCSPPSAPR
jgi:hypothetical protein